MGIVNRLVANKYVRVLKRAGDTDPNVLADVKSNLISCGESVIPTLLELLEHPDARIPAKEVLSALLTDKSLPAFVAALSSDDARAANTVVEILASGERFEAARLLDYLSVPEVPKGRLHSILEKHRNDIPARVLVDFVAGCDKDARAIIFKLLDRHERPEIAQAILPLLHHDDWWMRIGGLRLIAKHPSDQGIEVATVHLKDPNSRVRLQAVQTLGSLEVRTAIPGLANALRDPDLKVHSAAIESLIALNDVSAVPYLVDVLKDESEYARRGAVEVLNEVATPDAIKDLLCALRDEDWWVRVRAADALGSLGGDKVVDAVLGLMSSDDVFLRRYAVEILNSVPNKKAVQSLINALDDSDWWVRERSIDALGKTGDREAVIPLVDLMNRDSAVAHLCARALGELQDEGGVEALCRLADSGSEEARREALNALARISKLQGIGPEEGNRIQQALQKHGFQQTSSHLRPLELRVHAPTADPEIGRTSEPRRVPLEAHPAAAGTPRASLEPARPELPIPTPLPDSHTPGQEMSSEPPVTLQYSDLAAGTQLLNRYRVVRKIGGGGFGHVYLVEDTSVGEDLVLKILNPQISMDETMIRRFIQELKYTRRITHKNVIRLYDFLEMDGSHAISMEYFPGESLGKILRREGGMEWTRGVRLAAQICEGIHAAHTEGIIHRDIKPPNILVGDNDSVKIVDFGLASMAQYSGSRLTKSGILIGTPYYMAPEQITGADVGIHSDIYSLGTLFFEMFAGKPPYEGETAVSILFQHLKSDVPRLRSCVPEVPDALDRLVAQAMSKEPSDRPKSAQEILDRLTALPIPWGNEKE